MSRARPHRTRHAAVAVVLAGGAAYPVAVAVQPAVVWALVVALLGAVAAGAGAGAVGGRRVVRSWPVVAGLLLAGACGDVLARAGVRLVAGAPIDETIVGVPAVVAGGILAGGWANGRALAARRQEAVEAGMPPGHVKPVGRLLLAAGCLVLAAAGVAQWRAPAGSVAAALVPPAVVVFAAVAGLDHQRVRRAALLEGWRRTGRVVDPAVARNWGSWVTVFLLGALVTTSLWWLPPAEPLRRTAEEGSALVAASFLEFFDRERLSREGLPGGGVAGESMPAREPTPPDVERRTVTVRDLSEWFLQPATTFVEGETSGAGGDPATRWGVTPQLIVTAALLGCLLLGGLALLRRRTTQRGEGLVAALAAWLAELKATVAAMLQRRVPRPTIDGGPHHRARADAGEPLPRRWLRPADPREQVKYDYLRVVDRAARRGVPRHRAQSPAEYVRVLGPVLPGHAGAVDEITEHFVEARYSHHPIGTGTAERTRTISRTLCRALRHAEPARPSGD